MPVWTGQYTNSYEIALRLIGRVTIKGEAVPGCNTGGCSIPCVDGALIALLGNQAEAQVNACLCKEGWQLPLTLKHQWVKSYLADVVQQDVMCKISCLRPETACTPSDEQAVFFADLAEKTCPAVGRFCKWLTGKVLPGECLEPSSVLPVVACIGSLESCDTPTAPAGPCGCARPRSRVRRKIDADCIKW